MLLVQQHLIELAWDHAMKATAETRVTREHTATERRAWYRWRRRWRELESDDPGERTLVICANCGRYRDGGGRWVLMPAGLRDVLAGARSLCVSHGLCSACSARAMHALKPPSGLEPAGPSPTRD